jgi:hypothetical protein
MKSSPCSTPNGIRARVAEQIQRGVVVEVTAERGCPESVHSILCLNACTFASGALDSTPGSQVPATGERRPHRYGRQSCKAYFIE